MAMPGRLRPPARIYASFAAVQPLTMAGGTDPGPDPVMPAEGNRLAGNSGLEMCLAWGFVRAEGLRSASSWE